MKLEKLAPHFIAVGAILIAAGIAITLTKNKECEDCEDENQEAVDDS